MQTFKISGTVVAVHETKAVGLKGFLVREIIVNTDPQNAAYPSPVLFRLKGDRCGLGDSLREGDEVNLEFSLDGRKWDSPDGPRYFTDHTVWKLEVTGGEAADDRKPIDEVWEAWKERYGENAADFCNFMDTACPDLAARKKSTGEKYSELCTEADKRVLLDAIESGNATADAEDLPF